MDILPLRFRPRKREGGKPEAWDCTEATVTPPAKRRVSSDASPQRPPAPQAALRSPSRPMGEEALVRGFGTEDAVLPCLRRRSEVGGVSASGVG